VKWQKARFIDPIVAGDPDTFWVLIAKPFEATMPELNDHHDGFNMENPVHGFWYKSNVLAPNGQFTMLVPQNAVELLPDFSDNIDPDDRFLLP